MGYRMVTRLHKVEEATQLQPPTVRERLEAVLCPALQQLEATRQARRAGYELPDPCIDGVLAGDPSPLAVRFRQVLARVTAIRRREGHHGEHLAHAPETC